MELDVVQLTQEFIAEPTESRHSNVTLTRRVADLLAQMDFAVEELAYTDAQGVSKLCIAARRGTGRGGLSLLSHDDTVPAGEGWTQDPFTGVVRNGRLYGRGACDMKGGLAAALCAAARMQDAELRRPLFLFVTADEEVQARGAREVAARSRLFKAAAGGYGVICEPTGLRVVNAHKGALRMVVTGTGKAAHTSTLKGVNANIKMIPFLVDMKEIYDLVLTAPEYCNEEFEPPRSEWCLGINDHNPALNITPARSVCTIGYRPMPGVDSRGLIARTRASARRHGLRFELLFHGQPLYTPPEAPVVRTALRVTGTRKPRAVPYGTDGLVYAGRMPALIVLGPGHIAQAHAADEWVALDQLERAVDVYAAMIQHVCVEDPD